jgi:glycosyltransferase involved in cell wall biosynthesis
MSQTVSIIIPTFNSATYLPDALESCLSQTHQDIEIIVVDDGSTDDTQEVTRQHPVTYVYQSNAGAAAARNRGWLEARGDFLQFLDADDVLMPTKLERCLQVLTPDVDVSYTDYECCSSDLQETMTTVRTITPEGNILSPLLNSVRSIFPCHAPLIRRSAAERTGRFNEELRNAADWYFWIELAAQGASFRYVDEILVRYRATPGSLSKNPLGMARGRLLAAEALQRLPLPPDFDLDRLLAARHHVLGLRLWDAADRSGAREQFREAIRLSHRKRSRQLSHYYLLLMTHVTRRQTAERFLARALAFTGKT